MSINIRVTSTGIREREREQITSVYTTDILVYEVGSQWLNNNQQQQQGKGFAIIKTDNRRTSRVLAIFCVLCIIGLTNHLFTF